MTNTPENFESTNICDGCPAAYALTGYVDNANDEPITELHLSMVENEAVTARRVLNRAAGKVACLGIEKKPVELPDTIPKTGSSQLLTLVAECPSFPEYLHERVGQPVSLTKVMLGMGKVAARFRKKLQ